MYEQRSRIFTIIPRFPQEKPFYEYPAIYESSEPASLLRSPTRIKIDPIKEKNVLLTDQEIKKREYISPAIDTLLEEELPSLVEEIKLKPKIEKDYALVNQLGYLIDSDMRFDHAYIDLCVEAGDSIMTMIFDLIGPYNSYQELAKRFRHAINLLAAKATALEHHELLAKGESGTQPSYITHEFFGHCMAVLNQSKEWQYQSELFVKWYYSYGYIDEVEAATSAFKNGYQKMKSCLL